VNLMQENMYENLTLVVNGNKVSLKVCNEKGEDVVSRSSYGGIYCAKLLS